MLRWLHWKNPHWTYFETCINGVCQWQINNNIPKYNSVRTFCQKKSMLILQLDPEILTGNHIIQNVQLSVANTHMGGWNPQGWAYFITYTYHWVIAVWTLNKLSNWKYHFKIWWNSHVMQKEHFSILGINSTCPDLIWFHLMKLTWRTFFIVSDDCNE